MCYPVNAAHEQRSMDLTVDVDGLLEVSEAPTGFMAIKRCVFDRMISECPTLKYLPDMRRDNPNRDWCYRFFDVMVEPETNRYLSEDYAFCKRWRDLGGKVYIDTTAKLGHTGQFVYWGDFERSLQLSPAMACGLPQSDGLHCALTVSRQGEKARGTSEIERKEATLLRCTRCHHWKSKCGC
jgi:hypothetical protein